MGRTLLIKVINNNNNNDNSFVTVLLVFVVFIYMYFLCFYIQLNNKLIRFYHYKLVQAYPSILYMFTTISK